MYPVLDKIDEIKQVLQVVYGEIKQNHYDNAISTFNSVAEFISELCTIEKNVALASVLINDKKYPYSLYHGVDTAIICAVTGKHFGMGNLEINSMISASLTMNLSMMDLLDQLYSRNQKLTAEERAVIEAHPAQSYAMLRNMGLEDIQWLTLVLQHHENLIGTGYPGKLDDSYGHQCAVILNVADMYAAMTAPRLFRAAFTTDFVAEKICTNFVGQFSQSLIDSFLSGIGNYPTGSGIKLETGEIGIVVDTEDQGLPTVAIIKNANGEMLEQRQCIENASIVSGVNLMLDDVGLQASDLWDFLLKNSVKTESTDDAVLESVSVLRESNDIVEFPLQENIDATLQFLSGFKLPALPLSVSRIIEELKFDDFEVEDIANWIRNDPKILDILMLEVPELEGIAQHQLIDEIGRMIIDSEMTLIPKIIFDFYLCAIAEVFDNQAALTAFKEEAYIQAKVMWRFSSSFEDISAMDAYFLGLFYHIGKLVLAIKNNRYLETEDNFQVSNLYNEAQKNHILITDFEVACFKTSHALVGYVIAEQLKLSEEILQAIANHHTHDFSTIGKSKVKSLIAMAQFVQNVVNHEIYDRPEDFEWEEHAETIVAELMLDDYTLDAFKSDVKEIAEQL